MLPGCSHRSVTTARAAGTSCGCRGVPLRREKQDWATPIGRIGYDSPPPPARASELGPDCPPAAASARRAARSSFCVMWPPPLPWFNSQVGDAYERSVHSP